MRGSECFGVTRNDRERVNALGIVFPHAGNLVDSVVELWLAAAPMKKYNIDPFLHLI